MDLDFCDCLSCHVWRLTLFLFVRLQHMVKRSYDVVKRWVNEAQEAASSDNIMVQVGHTDIHSM